MIEIKHRQTGAVIYRSESAGTVCQAVVEAVRAAADLGGADLYGAYLYRANLGEANLSGANLREIRADLLEVLRAYPAEVAGLLAALRAGRVDGSCYEGACCCLVGTIAALRSCDYRVLSPDSGRPVERWFLAINPGDKPENSQVAAITAQWIEEWMVDK